MHNREEHFKKFQVNAKSAVADFIRRAVNEQPNEGTNALSNH